MNQFQDSQYPHRTASALAVIGAVFSLAAFPAIATPFFFSTGDPDGKMAMASRPSGTSFEIETADDFVVTQTTQITSATFTGLLAGGLSSDIASVAVEIYRVFPQDSNTGRTSGAPFFGTSQVPTRVNSPSDVAFDVRDSSTAGALTF